MSISWMHTFSFAKQKSERSSSGTVELQHRVARLVPKEAEATMCYTFVVVLLVWHTHPFGHGHVKIRLEIRIISNK
jgi:hypothetical protein